MVDVHLRLFGQVGWFVHDRFEPIPGTTRAGVILSLAEARGGTVSVGSLIDRLWMSAPRSGANAVQRHVSALRRQLRELGVPDPQNVLQAAPGGYRLGRATTDLEIVEDLVQDGSTDLDDPCWWDEPLIGAPWETSESLRCQLTQLASQALLSWSATVPVEEAAEVTRRADRMLAHSPDCLAAAEVRRTAERRLRDRRGDPLDPMGVEKLREIAGLWAHGRGTHALDLLDASTDNLPVDLARRFCRALVWLDPAEPWARHMVSTVVEEGISNPVQHERSVISLDARVLEGVGDGQGTVQAEVEGARTEWDLVRALRVQFMFGLSSPHDESLDKVVDQLASIDHPDAQVESRRFRFLSHLRRGDLEDARGTLLDYSDCVERFWPDTGDDFAPMAIAALQRSIDATTAAVFGPTVPQIGGFAADRWVLPTSETARLLLLNDPTQALNVTQYHIALATLSRAAQSAMQLLAAGNAGEAVAERAHGLAGLVPSLVREKQFLLLPVALGVVAEKLRDRSLADVASSVIQPWAGQTLGMWPVDAFFGPADVWLDRLGAV